MLILFCRLKNSKISKVSEYHLHCSYIKQLVMYPQKTTRGSGKLNILFRTTQAPENSWISIATNYFFDNPE
jgi:hypothetical protein